MLETVRFALDQGASVVVATPPYVSVRHEAQQKSLASELSRVFDRVPRFKYVNLGRVTGNRALAARLASELSGLVPAR